MVRSLFPSSHARASWTRTRTTRPTFTVGSPSLIQPRTVLGETLSCSAKATTVA
jgi:hypothetical protein